MNYLSIKYIAIIFLYRFTFQRAGCQFCNHSSVFYVLHFYCQSVVWCYGRYIWPVVKKKRNWTRNNKKILFLNNKHNDVEPWRSCDCRPGRWGEPLKHAMNIDVHRYPESWGSGVKHCYSIARYPLKRNFARQVRNILWFKFTSFSVSHSVPVNSFEQGVM